jgi:MFS superfamily sulfate permease-like transporter
MLLFQSDMACTLRLPGAIMQAIFGIWPQTLPGPWSALAAVFGWAVLVADTPGREDAVTMVAMIPYVSGIKFLLFALFTMDWISQLLSKAVITGILFGAAIEVVIGETQKLTRMVTEGSNSW